MDAFGLRRGARDYRNRQWSCASVEQFLAPLGARHGNEEKRFVGPNQKRVVAKKSAVKKGLKGRSSSVRERRSPSRQASRKRRTSKSVAVRRKERNVDEARRRLIVTQKELATEELPN